MHECLQVYPQSYAAYAYYLSELASPIGHSEIKMQLISSAVLRAVSAYTNCRQVTELSYFI